ncbi:alkaline phosphatase D family protein [Halegenticoccus tardaugens]|uniref:alkaline phosphatase D family protein n=1 Tax=Halegenticoccus tardaugens TaxID=2071624 RepID=UPI00100A841F|nr:alkaline phosphatase D family protein [Halegenticoccus tardaugens]
MAHEGSTDAEPGGTRRDVLRAAGAASLCGAVATLLADGAMAEEVAPEPTSRSKPFAADGTDDDGTTFSHSVASGDPTPSGVVLWTRVHPEAYDPDVPLGVEVAADEEFTEVAYRGVVEPSAIDPADDYAVKAELDGELPDDSRLYYRFVYDGVRSRVGRCRTLPEPTDTPEKLSLAVVTCQDFRNGYYGAFARVADEEVDFLVHLGDLIYEYAGESEYVGRDVALPSGKSVAHGLEDFRYLHRRYRSDRHLRRALERHTLVAIWDDHEIVNNRYWDYEEDRPYAGPGDHPRNDEPEFMRRLHAEGIKAWWEYVPARVGYDPDADHLLDVFELRRTLRFGDLADLVLTDERLFRSDPGGDVLGETGRADPGERDDADRTMLGSEQRQWFVNEIAGSEATWTVWANEVLNAALKAGTSEATFYLNHDAWDGFEHERRHIMGELDRNGVENFVALTGDMHSYVAGYLQHDYETLAPLQERLGVEFMTPAVTSANLKEVLGLPGGRAEEEAIEATVRSQNPHVEFFNSHRWGYSVVEFTPDDCTYRAYSVDKSVDAADAPRELLRVLRVPSGEYEIHDETDDPL